MGLVDGWVGGLVDGLWGADACLPACTPARAHTTPPPPQAKTTLTRSPPLPPPPLPTTNKTGLGIAALISLPSSSSSSSSSHQPTRVAVGNRRYMEEREGLPSLTHPPALSTPATRALTPTALLAPTDACAALEASGKTLVYVAVARRLVGVLAVADKPRPEAQATVAALHRMGVEVCACCGPLVYVCVMCVCTHMCPCATPCGCDAFSVHPFTHSLTPPTPPPPPHNQLMPNPNQLHNKH